MIAASEPQEFIPFGRQQIRQHPGVKKEAPPPFDTSLLFKLSHFKIQDEKPSEIASSSSHQQEIVTHLCQKPHVPSVLPLPPSEFNNNREWWLLRGDSSVEEEELYYNDSTAVWSRGMAGRTLATDSSAGRQLCSCYTLEEPIEQALWCNFSKLKNGKFVPIPSICLLESSTIRIFTTDGEDFLSSLQFKVSSIWATSFGLLLERMSSNSFTSGKPLFSPSTVDSLCFPEMHKLPKIFSLLHPLDEIAPVLVFRQGASVGFMDNRYQKIVFTSADTSLCMLYDAQSGQHSIWRIRKATSEECQFMCGNEPASIAQITQSSIDTNSSTLPHRFISGISSLNRNQHYPSPLNSHHMPMSGSRGSDSPLPMGLNNSVPNPFKYLNTTSAFMSAGQGNVHTPSSTCSWGSQGLASATRLHRGSATTPTFSDARLGTSQSVVDNGLEAKPIVPELCLDYVWSENLALPCYHDGDPSPASRVFIGKDLIGQSFLYYVVPSRSRLFCVSYSKKGRGDLSLSTHSTLPAKDAAYLPALQIIAVLEPAGGVVLYTGTALIGKLHVAGISTALASPSYLSSSSLMIAQLQNSVTNSSSQRRKSLLSSTVVGEASFDEKVHLLSPVKPNTPNNIDFATPHQHMNSTPKDSHISSLRDPVANRLTLEFLNGTMFRVTLPNICSSPLVCRCLEVLKSVLPRDVALQVIVKWCGARNAPGTQDFSPIQEWQLFESLLLGLLGYNVEKLPTMQLNSTSIPEAPSQILRKKRASYCGSDDDWDYLLNSQLHGKMSHGLQSLLALSEPLNAAELMTDEEQGATNNDTESTEPSLDTSSMLFKSIHLILFSLHLLYEDLKLDLLLAECLPMLACLLHQLAADLRMNSYVEHYWRDFPIKCSLKVSSIQMSEENLKLLVTPVYFTETPPDVMKHIYRLIMEHSSLAVTPYTVISHVNQRSKDIVQMIGVLCTSIDNLEKLVKVITLSGMNSVSRPPKDLTSVTKIKANTYGHIERVVFLLSELGYTTTELSSLPAGIALILGDAIHHVRENPPTDWPEPVYRLIGRQDLAASLPAASDCQSPTSVFGDRRSRKSPLPVFTRADPENEDGMEITTDADNEILKLRFNADHRVAEVRSLLQSSRPVTISIPQRPEFSDHEFIEEQEKHLYAICTRTMALPVGRGMFTLHTLCPVASEPLSMPRLCLSGKAPPRGTTVDLSHIEVVPNMNLWPLFHNGVAAGLRISPTATNINSSWIVYNKPKGGPEVLPEHAGFLMALGLNGHLSSLVELNTFKYLSRCHEMTSVGLLLGISASRRGTMDVQTTKLLSVHIESLLPPTSIELDIVQNIQVAALLGVGLVYQKTAHRHIAEVLLSEIGRPPGPEMENSVDRESYSLSAGLALGLVVLGTGSNATGLADLGIADTLHHYMVGGKKRPISGSQKEKYKSPSYQIKEGDEVNIDVTAPGATLALGMMFFNSGNKAVANWMKAPDTQFLLDFVCPDLLLLRIVARGLILWDEILPTEEWVQSHVPDVIRPYCLVKPVDEEIDYETMNQAYCNIIAGACMAMGLKFAGSANNEAFTTLLNICKVFTTMFTRSIAELAGKSTIETCLNVILLSLAMVMAGTGELEVIRLVRYLRSRVRQGSNSVVTYGSHLATHMALGLLFLGSGRYSLSTSAESVAAMLCAFFPKFPTHSNDNRYHLQAFRHLYVLAATPRLLLPRDIDSGSLCYAHLTVVYLNSPYYVNQAARLKAPCLLPELNLLKEVRVEDDRYWSIVFRRDENWNQLEKILSGSKCLAVKQRAGCLSYREDPHGFRSLLAHTLTSDKVVSWSVPAESIFSFSSTPSTLNFVRLFLESENSGAASPNEIKLLHFLTKLVFDCVTHDKMSILLIWIAIIQGIQTLTTNPVSAGNFIWQLKHVIGYALNLPKTVSQTISLDGHHDNGQKPYFSSDPLISAELALTIKQQVSNLLDDWLENDIKDVLTSYMKSEEISTSDKNMAKLAMYVLFHDIPSPKLMSQVLSLDDCLINPVSIALMLKRSESNLSLNKFNHLAMIIKKIKTVN